MQLHLVFNSDPSRYSTDAQKISYAASYLDGTAKDWFRPNVNANTGAISFPTWTAFVDALKAAFDDPDAMATAEYKLMASKQNNRDWSPYHAEFVTLAAILAYDDRTQISFFKRGLNQELQRAITYQLTMPTIFNEYVQACIKLDNNIRADKALHPRIFTNSNSRTP